MYHEETLRIEILDLTLKFSKQLAMSRKKDADQLVRRTLDSVQTLLSDDI